MLSFNLILNGAKALLEERFPGDAVYTNVTPNGFQRPSFLIEFGEIHMTDSSEETLRVTLPLVVTAFVAVDSYHNSDVEKLLTRMAAVQELFAISGLQIQDRVLHVVGNKAEYNWDFAEVTITLDYLDDRPGGEDWPLMGEINTKTELKEG